MASGTPDITLRERVSKTAVENTTVSDKEESAKEEEENTRETVDIVSLDTVENARNELKFVNEAGDEIEAGSKTLSEKISEEKESEEVDDDEENSASVVIVRNE